MNNNPLLIKQTKITTSIHTYRGRKIIIETMYGRGNLFIYDTNDQGGNCMSVSCLLHGHSSNTKMCVYWKQPSLLCVLMSMVFQGEKCQNKVACGHRTVHCITIILYTLLVKPPHAAYSCEVLDVVLLLWTCCYNMLHRVGPYSWQHGAWKIKGISFWTLKWKYVL